MNLTYVLGNGMDLQLGLHTSFFDFYEWAEKNNKENMFLPHRYENKDEESWSDFENKFIEIINDQYYWFLGQEDNIIQKDYIEYYEKLPLSYAPEQHTTHDFVEFIVDEFDDLILYLDEYLTIIDNRIKNHPNLKNILTKVENDISHLTKLFNNNEENVKRINEYIKTSNTLDFNIATLNYTSTTMLLKKNITNSLHVKYGGNTSTFRHKNTKALYVHGKLEDETWNAGIVLGTFSTSVLHKDLQAYESSKFLSKIDRLKTMMGREDYTKFENLFNSKRNIIVCYGVSFGESDKKLLDIVLQKAFKGEAIILFYEFENSKKSLARREYNLREDLLKKFSSSLDLEEETILKIKENFIAIPINEKVNFLSNDNKLNIKVDE